MDKNQSDYYYQNLSQQSNLSKLNEARFKKAMQNRVQNLTLSNIIGLTSTDKSNMQFNPVTGELYYIAGSTIVVYNIDQNVQKRYIQSPNKRNLVSLCFSKDGRYLAAGEGTCKQPEIIIWDLSNYGKKFLNDSFILKESEKPFKQLKGHKIGLKMIFFSPDINAKYLISIGNENDKGLFVWDWNKEERITLNKMSKVPYSACFSDDGTKFVTCGEKHIKLWQFQPNGDIIKTPVKEKENAYIIEGKSINLGTKFQDKTFTDCEFDKQSKYLYASTSTGQLCIVDENKTLNKWMDLKVNRVFNIALSKDYIICSCTESFIRIFKTITLDHIVTLPKIPPLLNYNIEKGVTKIKPVKSEYADVVGLVFDEIRGRISSLFSDRSLFIWDVQQLDKITMKRTFLNHSGGINDLQILNNPSSSEVTFFMTTSTDRTARIWHEISEEGGKQQEQNLGLRRNAYSKNLSRIIYLTKEFESFKFQEQNLNQNEEEGINNEINDKEYPTCIKSTMDGSQIILANNKGTLTFMNISKFEVEHEIQAHDKEIQCIDLIETPHHRMLATGGRDRQIKIFDLNNHNRLIFTLEDHSSSIVALKFAVSQDQQTIYLVSAANDRQIIFREFKNYNFVTIHREVDKNNKINSLDLSTDHQTLFVGFDKKINSYSITTGKPIKSTETKEDEKVAKTYLDNLSILTDVSSTYVASFNQDKIIRIRDCSTMAVVSKAYCGDQVSGMGFTMNNSHLITSSSEGIIYIWKISSDLKNNIEKKKQSLGIIARKLQDLFKQEGQNMINTKDWNLGSFWIEEEMRQHLMQQQKLNQNIPLQKEDSADPALANLKPYDLMKNTNLPNWAKTKPTNIQNNNLNQQPQKNTDEDNLLNDFKDRINGDKKIGGYQPAQKTNNFVSDSEIIGDSINGRYLQASSITQAVQSKQQNNQHGFGLDSINEREYNDNDNEDDGIFTNSKKVASVIGYNQNNQQKSYDVSPNNNNNINAQNKIDHPQNEQPLYIYDNKLIGLNQQQDDDQSDDFQYNSDHISQFLAKQDMTIPVSSTQAQLYNKLSLNKQVSPNQQDNQQVNDLEVEDIYNQENKRNASNVNSSQSLKSDKDSNEFKYKKDNGMLSLFSVDQIQGQLQKVESNIKQAENNFKFKEEQLNIFQSNNQPLPFRPPVSNKLAKNNLIHSINIHDPNYQNEDEYRLEDGLIMLDEDESEEPAIQNKDKLSAPYQPETRVSINKLTINQDTTQPKQPPKADQEAQAQQISVDLDRIQIKDQAKQTFKTGSFKQESNSDEIKYDSNKLQSYKTLDKKLSPTQLIPQKEEEEVEIIHEEIANQSTTSQEYNSNPNQKQKKQWGVENKKPKEQEKIFSQSKIQSIMGEVISHQNQKKNIYPLEELNDEFDESYAVSNTKEYQYYQNEIDNSFKIILEQLNKIEDIVENKLDYEPVSIRKKVYEKIQLKANKVKASLQNINYKQQTANQSNNTSQFNISSMEHDFVNKDLLENYSKLLLEAVLKRK